MVFTYPMECYVARHIIFSYYDFFSQRPAEPTPITPPTPQPSLLDKFSRSATPKLLKSFFISKDTPILQNQQRSESLPEEPEEETQIQANFVSPIHSQSTHHPEDSILVRESSSNHSNPSETSPPKSLFVHVTVTLVLWGTTVLIALVFSELSIVLALTGRIFLMNWNLIPLGAVAASALGYIIPSLVYLKTYRREFDKAMLSFEPSSEYYQATLLKRVRAIRRFIFPFCLLIFGIISLFIGVGTVIYEYAQNASSSTA